jgi:hypothetical protein
MLKFNVSDSIFKRCMLFSPNKRFSLVLRSKIHSRLSLKTTSSRPHSRLSLWNRTQIKNPLSLASHPNRSKIHPSHSRSLLTGPQHCPTSCKRSIVNPSISPPRYAPCKISVVSPLYYLSSPLKENPTSMSRNTPTSLCLSQ